MNSWQSENNKKLNEMLAVDRLESDTLPPTLEDAEAEYFADMAFDDRLLQLVEIETPIIEISLDHATTATQDGFARRYFAPNDIRPLEIELDDDRIETIEEPLFRFKLTGTLERHPNRLGLKALIQPDDIFDTSPVLIEDNPNNPNSFIIMKLESDFEFEEISTADLFTLLCQLSGTAKKDVDLLHKSLVRNKLAKPSVYRANIEALWAQFGETSGVVTTSHQLVHEIEKPTRPDSPERIQILRQEIEKPDLTQILLVLKHTTRHLELDVEDSYQLRLRFEHTNGSTVEKDAKRIVASGIRPELVGLGAYQQSKGRITKLSLGDVTIKELFVDWFDQVIGE